MEQQAGPAQPLSRTSLIQQVLQHAATTPIVVSQDTPVLVLPAVIAENRHCRTIAVADEAGRLVGIIPVASVLQDLLFHIMPEELLANAQEPERAAALVRALHARTAGDLMHPPLSLSRETTVQEAIHQLHQEGLEGLPVVDEGQRVVGYADLLETMLACWPAPAQPPSRG